MTCSCRAYTRNVANPGELRRAVGCLRPPSSESLATRTLHESCPIIHSPAAQRPGATEAEEAPGHRRYREPLALAVWGLWASGVILTGPVPLPATQVNAVAAADSWALAGRDVAHTSAIPIHNGFEGREVWRIEMPEPLRAPPAVSGDQVFLGTGDNRFIAFDAADGQVIWERKLSLLTSTAAAVTSDAVYLTARSGELFALDRHSGEELWRFEGDSAFFASPIVYRGVVYAGAWNGALYAVDAQDGRELWTFQADGSIIAPPAFQGDLMALPIDDRLVYVIDLATGQKRLIFDAGHVLVESPVFTGDHLLISTGRGRLWAVDWDEARVSV